MSKVIESAATTQNPGISRLTMLAMAATCGFAVANIYYNQPMLGDVARSFSVSEAAVGAIPTATQIGYAFGLLLIVPLGDKFERRRVILILNAALIAALVLAAAAPNFYVLVFASLLVGLGGTVAQQVVPLAARLAPPEKRGSTVGLVMSGLLIGILGARTLSGFVAEYYGWRTMFWIAAGLMLMVMGLVLAIFPRVAAASRQTYSQLLLTMISLAKNEPTLREAALTGAFIFASFSVFWSTLTLHLESPIFHLGPAAAGLFGLIGIVGALAAPFVGRFSDSVSPRRIVGFGILCALASFVIFTAAGTFLSGLVIGVILLDLGVQAAQIANQSRIYALSANAQSSVNAVYMFAYFIGGAAGSVLGSIAWSAGGWTAVGFAGCAAAGIAWLIHFKYSFAKPVSRS